MFALLGSTAGCGGSSGGHGAADDFVGRWEIDPDSDPFTFGSCSDGSDPFQVYVWNEVVFEYGELNDLTETSGTCAVLVQSSTGNQSAIPGMGYDVSGNSAKLAAEDQYTGNPPLCYVSAGTDPTYGYPIAVKLSPSASDWMFQLEPAAKGQPRRAVLGGGSVPAAFVEIDDYGTEHALLDCKLTGETTFFRVSTE